MLNPPSQMLGLELGWAGLTSAEGDEGDPVAHAFEGQFGKCRRGGVAVRKQSCRLRISVWRTCRMNTEIKKIIF